MVSALARGTERFLKSERLLSRQEFLAVQERGAKVSSDCLLALFVRSAKPGRRIGFTVSSKVGNAVVRNRVRRRLREIYRKRRETLPEGVDVVLIARASAAPADSERLGRAFSAVAQGIARRIA